MRKSAAGRIFAQNMAASHGGSILGLGSSSLARCCKVCGIRRSFITETLIPPKDDLDTKESEDKSDFRDFVSNWLDKIRGNSSELEKVIITLPHSGSHGACPPHHNRFQDVHACSIDKLCDDRCIMQTRSTAGSFTAEL